MSMQPTILKSSDEVASNLNMCLADATVFWYALHNHHWFVTGTEFFTLHLKYEEMYTRWAQVVDDLAERLLTIGYKPVGTLKESLELSAVSEITGTPLPEERVRATLEDLRVMHERMGTTIEHAVKSGDKGTENLLDEIRDVMEKNMWMLRAYLG